MGRNPFFEQPGAREPEGVLAFLRRILESHLRARSAEAVIPDAELRALHPLLAIPRVWDRVRQELGL